MCIKNCFLSKITKAGVVRFDSNGNNVIPIF